MPNCIIGRIISYRHAVTPAAVLLPDCDGLAWVDDGALLPDERAVLRTYTTARRGNDGRLCWPTDEITGGAP